MSLVRLETALAALEKLAREGAPPHHHLAREVLLALGRAIVDESETSLLPLLDRCRSAGRALEGSWDQAVQTELTMACGEFAQSLDPRFLRLPNYDLAYTRAARDRLEDRLRSARALGFGLSSEESEVLALADQVLATLPESGRAGGPASPAPGKKARTNPDSGDRSFQNKERKRRRRNSLDT